MFRRLIRKKLNDVSAPICVEREEVTKVASKRVGSSVSMVHIVKTPIEKYVVVMPTSKEYDLEEMFKAGVNPQQLNVRGIIQGKDNFDVSAEMQKLNEYVEQNLKND